MTLLELLKLLRKHIKLVIVLPVIAALATAAFCWGMMSNQYTATVSMYVLTATDQQQKGSSSAYSDLNASQMIANDIATLANTYAVKEKAAQALRLDSIKGNAISVTSSTTTRVIELSVTSDNADSAAVVANQVASTLNDMAKQTMGVESVNVIDEAKTPTSPSGPNRAMYTAVAFLAGLFLAIAIVVLMDMINTRVRTPEEAEELLGVPVIGRIPVIKG